MLLCFCSCFQSVDLAHSFHLYSIRLEQSPTADLLYSDGEFPEEGSSPDTDIFVSGPTDRVPRSVRQFRVEPDFRFTGASTTQLRWFDTFYSASPRRWI